MRFALIYSLAGVVVCVGVSGCAALYVPVVGVGQDSSGKTVLIWGGGGGALGAGGVGITCGTTCNGDPNGEVCRYVREETKKKCGIKEAGQ